MLNWRYIITVTLVLRIISSVFLQFCGSVASDPLAVYVSRSPIFCHQVLSKAVPWTKSDEMTAHGVVEISLASYIHKVSRQLIW